MNGAGLPSHYICLRFERDKSVYFWSRGSYLLYNATIVEEIQQKNNLIYSEARRSAFHHLVYFVKSTGIIPLTDTSNIAAMTINFVVESYFLVCLFVNVTLHNNGEY